MDTVLNVVVLIVVVAVGLLLALGIPAAYSALKDKVDDDRVKQIMEYAYKWLRSAIAATNNTFVNQLKADGKFDIEAQAAAFKKTMSAWLGMMTKDMLEIIRGEVGDFDVWAKTMIEGEVAEQKQAALAAQVYTQELESEIDVDIENWPLEQLHAFCVLNGVCTEGCEDREDYIAAIEDHFA